jgi:GAF domain-containing protein
MRQHLLHHVRKILDHDDRFCTGILELMFELARGIQRVGVHHHQTRPQYAEQRNRVLQNVRHHQGNAIARRQARFALQPGRERAAQLIELGKTQRCAHIRIGGQIAVGGADLVEHLRERGILIGVDIGGYTGRIVF